MRNMFAFELRRAFTGAPFLLALAVGLILAVANIVLVAAPSALSNGYGQLVDGAVGMNPPSLFGNWIGLTPGTITTAIFYYVVPLIACMPFAASLCSDLDSRYASQVIVREGRGRYFIAKTTTVFLISGVVVIVPLVVNIVTAACLLPQIPPDPTTRLYAVMANSMLAGLFFACPWGYISLFLVLTFIGAGIFGLASSVLAFFVRNVFIVLLVPFAFCAMAQLVTQGTFLAGFAPLNVLLPAQPFPSIFWIVACAMGLTLVVLVAVVLFSGMRYEEL